MLDLKGSHRVLSLASTPREGDSGLQGHSDFLFVSLKRCVDGGIEEDRTPKVLLGGAGISMPHRLRL